MRPVHLERERVAGVVELAGSPRREPQDRRAAQAPVGHEQGADLSPSLVPCAKTPADGAASPSRPFSLASSMWNVKSDGTVGVAVCPSASARAIPAEPLPPPVARRTRSALTSSPPESLAANLPLRRANQAPQGAARGNAHAGLARGGHEAVDDGRRTVGDWEHPAVLLLFQLDAAGPEPCDRVPRTEPAQGANELPRAAWVVLGHFSGVKARMGDIAAAPARDAHLGEKVRGGLVEGHLRRGIRLGACDRAEEPGRAAPRHKDPRVLGHGRAGHPP